MLLSLPNQLRSLWNFKQNLLGYQTIIPTCINQVGCHQIATMRHGVVQNIQNSSISTKSTWIFTKLKTQAPGVTSYQVSHLKFGQPNWALFRVVNGLPWQLLSILYLFKSLLRLFVNSCKQSVSLNLIPSFDKVQTHIFLPLAPWLYCTTQAQPCPALFWLVLSLIMGC